MKNIIDMGTFGGLPEKFNGVSDASILVDKKTEPPVIAVAADGSVVVPLLGGHNGANRMAGAIAEATKTNIIQGAAMLANLDI